MVSDFGFVTINGARCDKISVFDHGLLYGDGVFETFRIFGGKAFLLNDHLDRLFASAKALQMTGFPSRSALLKMIRNTYRQTDLDDAFIRLIITRGIGRQGLGGASQPNVIIIVNSRGFSPLEKIGLTICTVRKVNKSAVDPRVKSLNYLNSMLAKKEAVSNNFDDGILLNEADQLTEATTANLFLVRNEQLFTPPSAAGILEGVTRKAVLENFEVIEKPLYVSDLFSAKEVFLSGTVNMITCVSHLNSHYYHQFYYAESVYKRLMRLTEAGTSLKKASALAAGNSPAGGPYRLPEKPYPSSADPV